MIVAQYPESELEIDADLARSLDALRDHDSEARLTDDFKIGEECWAEQYRLINRRDFPLMLAVLHPDEYEIRFLLFSTHRAADAAFAAWVEVLRESHREICETIKGKCAHEWIDGKPPTCPACGRSRAREPWPLQRGKKCSPKTWVECIRPDGDSAF